MPILGRYEAQQEIARTGLNCIWSAKHLDHPGGQSYALKELRPAVDLVSAEAFEPLIDGFLERAAVQKQLSDSKAPHWVPVHDLGKTETGAYFVTDYYPRSAAKLIRGRIKLSAGALHHIIDSVIQGLFELENNAGRSHGNLKSSNVLIGGEGSIERSPVMISDPAPLQEVLVRGGEGADLHSIGELIHELVLHKPFDEGITLPLPKSTAWSRMGSAGKNWLDLCNRLLAQDPATIEKGLAGVQREVKGLGSARRRPMQIAAILLLLIVAGALGWAAREYFRYQREWAQLRDVSRGWVAQLVGAMGYTPKRDLLASDDHIKQTVLPELSNMPDELSGGGDASAVPPLSLDAMRRTRTALAKVQTLRSALSPEQWPLLKQWRDRLDSAQSQHLEAPTQYLTWVLSDLDLDKPNIDVLRGISRLLYLQTHDAQTQFDTLETNAKQLQQAQTDIESAHDPVLSQFRQFVHDSVASAFNSPDLAASSENGNDLLKSLVTRTDGLVTLGSEIKNAVQTEWSGNRIDTQRLADAASSPTTQGAPTEQTFRDRIELAKLYRVAPDEGTRVVGELSKLKDSAASELSKLQSVIDASNQGEAKQFETRLAGSTSQIEALRQRHWVVRDVRDKVGDPVQKDLDLLIADIRNKFAVSASSVEEWRNNVAKIGAKHEQINQAWQTRLNDLLGGRSNEQLRQNAIAFRDLRDQVEAWRKAMLDVDSRFPSPPEVPKPFQAAAQAKWQQAIEKAIASIGTSGKSPAVDTAKIDAAVASLSKWQNDLRDLSQTCDEVTARLNEGYAPDEAIATAGQPTVAELEKRISGNAIASDAGVADAIAPVKDRLAALRALGTQDPSQLARIVDDFSHSQPELIVAALRRLLTGPPPTALAQFKAETDARRKLDEMLSHALKSSATRRDLLARQLGANAEARWVHFVSQPVQPDQIKPVLDAAVHSIDVYGVKADAQLPAWVSYNLSLYRYREELNSRPANQSRDELVAFSRDLREHVPRELSQRFGVAALLTALRDFESQPQPSGPTGDWRLVAGGGSSETRSYAWAIDAETQRKLDFVLIQPEANGQPFYLATTELPLDLFIDLIDHDADLRRLVLSTPVANFQGPRVWEPTASGIRKTRYWLPMMGVQINLYHQDVQDQFNQWAMKETQWNTSPTGRHPVQQISATAATSLARAVGCRLPTPEEWQAAYQKYEAATPRDPNRNLRDQTWGRQAEYISRLNIDPGIKSALRPSAGAFLPQGENDIGDTVPWDDRTLWFRAVDSDNKTVHQLVGNVAELTSDASGKFFVIGASALSSPKLQPDKPYPVSDANATYSDVGVRLAFPVPGPELARLKAILAAQNYLLGPKD